MLTSTYNCTYMKNINQEPIVVTASKYSILMSF